MRREPLLEFCVLADGEEWRLLDYKVRAAAELAMALDHSEFFGIHPDCELFLVRGFRLIVNQGHAVSLKVDVRVEDVRADKSGSKDVDKPL